MLPDEQPFEPETHFPHAFFFFHSSYFLLGLRVAYINMLNALSCLLVQSVPFCFVEFSHFRHTSFNISSLLHGMELHFDSCLLLTTAKIYGFNILNDIINAAIL